MKKKECIIHIGMHKTGSTSIQAVLQVMEPNEEICYFDLGHPNHTERIVSLFSRERVCLAHQKMGWGRERIEIYKEETRRLFDKNITRCPAPRMILSGEGIIGLEEKELEALRDFLHRYFEEISVFAYVRNPREYLESYFQELVKLGTGEFVVEQIFPKYRMLFEKFDRVFGRDNVTLRVFDLTLLKGGDVVKDFLSWCGITVSSGLDKDTQVNTSLSKEALSMLYLYRKHGPGYGKGPEVIRENNRMIAALKQIKGEKLRFSSELVNRLSRRHHEEIVWIEERLGVSWRISKEDSPTAVVSEEDLLKVSDTAVAALEAISGVKTNNLPSDHIERICTLLHRLRKKPFREQQKKEAIRVIEAGELAVRLRKRHPKMLSGIEEQRLRFLIGKVLQEMKGILLEEGEETLLRFLGFGELIFAEKKSSERRFSLKIKERGKITNNG